MRRTVQKGVLTSDLGTRSRSFGFRRFAKSEMDRLAFFKSDPERDSESLVTSLAQVEVIDLDFGMSLSVERVISFVGEPSEVEVDVIGTRESRSVLVVIDLGLVRSSSVIESRRTFLRINEVNFSSLR